MGAMSRNKGAAAERAVAKELFAELGIHFARNLKQTQQSGQSDLIPDDSEFPFSVEVKSYAEGHGFRAAWMEQAQEAAKAEGNYPCVIWKSNRSAFRCRVWLEAVAEALGSTAITHRTVDMDISTFAWIAREIMVRRAEKAWSLKEARPDGAATLPDL